jgi:hypothetical protein
MIQTKDFRISNLIYHKEDIEKAPYTIRAVLKQSVLVFEQFEEILIEEVEPIPLTDEWKIKFGGVKKGVEWQFKIGEFTTCFEETPEGFFYTGGEGVSLSRNIEFVHDFQNIVYAIGGIEVQINQSAK